MGNIITIVQDCPVCGLSSDMDVDTDRWLRWKRGEMVQNVFPDKDTDWRECLVSGIHAACWLYLVGDEEEEDI